MARNDKPPPAKGWHETARQPQGDFGRGRDHAALGSSDDVNRPLNEEGAYRDAEPPEGDSNQAAQVPAKHP